MILMTADRSGLATFNGTPGYTKALKAIKVFTKFHKCPIEMCAGILETVGVITCSHNDYSCLLKNLIIAVPRIYKTIYKYATNNM